MSTIAATPTGLEPEGERARLIEEARALMDDDGDHLAWRDDDGDVHVLALRRDWTRIGRSIAADVRFDDPSVSRRHALVVRQPDGVRVLDERSLDGTYVNAERVAWRELRDGDEIVVGRHRLVYLHG